jgi:hypothetical protein
MRTGVNHTTQQSVVLAQIGRGEQQSADHVDDVATIVNKAVFATPSRKSHREQQRGEVVEPDELRPLRPDAVETL